MVSCVYPEVDHYSVKDILNFPKWTFLLKFFKASATTVMVFNMFVSDHEDFSAGVSLIYRRFGGLIQRSHIQRSISWLVRKGFLKTTGEIHRNKRGKGTPVYRLNPNLLELAVDQLSQFDTRLKADNVPKTNVPDSVDYAVGKPLEKPSKPGHNVPDQDG